MRKTGSHSARNARTNDGHFGDQNETRNGQLMFCAHEFQALGDDLLLASCENTCYAVRFRHQRTVDHGKGDSR